MKKKNINKNHDVYVKVTVKAKNIKEARDIVRARLEIGSTTPIFYDPPAEILEKISASCYGLTIFPR